LAQVAAEVEAALRLEQLGMELLWQVAVLAAAAVAGYSCRIFMFQMQVIPSGLARAALAALPRSSISRYLALLTQRLRA
jgi:hypothetical protein